MVRNRWVVMGATGLVSGFVPSMYRGDVPHFAAKGHLAQMPAPRTKNNRSRTKSLLCLHLLKCTGFKGNRSITPGICSLLFVQAISQDPIWPGKGRARFERKFLELKTRGVTRSKAPQLGLQAACQPATHLRARLR